MLGVSEVHVLDVPKVGHTCTNVCIYMYIVHVSTLFIVSPTTGVFKFSMLFCEGVLNVLIHIPFLTQLSRENTRIC